MTDNSICHCEPSAKQKARNLAFRESRRNKIGFANTFPNPQGWETRLASPTHFPTLRVGKRDRFVVSLPALTINFFVNADVNKGFDKRRDICRNHDSL